MVFFVYAHCIQTIKIYLLYDSKISASRHNTTIDRIHSSLLSEEKHKAYHNHVYYNLIYHYVIQTFAPNKKKYV